MFLPQNMKEDEKSLAATIVRQMLAGLPPDASPEDRQAMVFQAEEIAAETIYEARASSSSTSLPPEAEQVPSDEDEYWEQLKAEEAAAFAAELAEWRRANPDA